MKFLLFLLMSIFAFSADSETAGSNVFSLENLIPISYAFVVIVVTLLIIVAINSLFKKYLLKIRSIKEKIFKDLKISTYEIFSARTQALIVLNLLKGLRLLVIFIVLSFAFPLLFSILPWTRGVTLEILGLILKPLKNMYTSTIGFIPNLITIIVIIYVVRQIVKVLRFFAEEIETKKLVINNFYPDWAKPTFNIVKTLLYLFTAIIIFPYLPGSDSDIFKGFSVFFGILISIGSSSITGNIIAGIVITYMRPFKIGDRVRVGDIVGDVAERTLLVTRIRTIKNERITLPNSKILSDKITNYSFSADKYGMILHATVTIGYDVPWKKVHKLLIDAAKATPGIENAPSPFVLQTSLDDFYVSYQINAYTKDAKSSAAIYSGLFSSIQDKFNEGGVEILSPHYRGNRDGNMITIPAEYLPADFEPASFRFQIVPEKKFVPKEEENLEINGENIETVENVKNIEPQKAAE